MGVDSTADWVTTEDYFLLQHPMVKWNTGTPIWTHGHAKNGVGWGETKYLVRVVLEEVQ